MSSSTPASTSATASPPGTSSSRSPAIPSPDPLTNTIQPADPAVDRCLVDRDTRAKWLSANPGASHPFQKASSESSTAQPTSQNRLSTDRVVSSIPKASTSYPSSEGSAPYSAPPLSARSDLQSSLSHPGGKEASRDESKWVYPSEQQFFQAMLRKQHNPKAADMRTIVPIHNAVNERAWEEVLAWEGSRGSGCGGPRLISFSGRPKDRSPKAWIKTIFG